MRRFERDLFSWALLAVIVAGYLGIAALYAIKTPAWQVPDEPAHYNYVAQLVHTGNIPVLQSGDWNNDYLNAIKAAGFKPSALDNKLDTVRYEDSQPPLFYILEAPVFALSNGSLLAMRLLSVMFGAGVVIVAYLLLRMAFPGQPYLALATAAFIAFLPQHVAMMAGMDNDSLTELLIALTLLACTRFIIQPSSAFTLNPSPEGNGFRVRAAFMASPADRRFARFGADHQNQRLSADRRSRRGDPAPSAA